MKHKLINLLLLQIGLMPFAANAREGKSPAEKFAVATNNNLLVDAALKESTIIKNLAQRHAGTLHLFSHGRPGALLWQGEWIGKERIARLLKEKINTPGQRIQHINIYGCAFARGAKGREALNYLQQVLGISVSASDDITGKDGDWILEAGTPVEVKGMEAYAYNLQCATLTPGSTDLDGDGTPDTTDTDDDNDGIPDDNEWVLKNSVSNATFTGNANGWQLNGGWQYLSNVVRNVTDNQLGANADDLNLLNVILDTECAETSLFTVRIHTNNYINSQGEGFDSDARLRVFIGGIELFNVYNPSSNASAVVTKTAAATVIKSFKVNGNTISGTTTNVAVGSFHSFSVELNANNLPATGNITFRFTANADDFQVDDVYYNVINCLDTDGDGIPNQRDLDSDNDGIPDYIETFTNTDNDGIPDYIDLDSDGDGCPDATEARITGTGVNRTSFGALNATPDGLTNAGCFVPLTNDRVQSLIDTTCKPIGAVDDIYNTSIGVAVTLVPLTGDSDPGGSTLLVGSINGVALTPGTAQTIPVPNGTVNVASNGALNFTPATGYTGTVTFPYQVRNAAGEFAVAKQIIHINTPLPVTLLNFSAIANHSKVVLDWATLKESNNKGFGIERSTDGKNWTLLDFVNSQAAATGNSSLPLNYLFTDPKPFKGNNYYRLIITGYDGHTITSTVQSVYINTMAEIKISPNPVSSYVLIAGLEGNEHIRIYDVTGKKVVQTEAVAAELKVRTSGWTKGFYLIYITDKEGNHTTYKVLKAE